MSAWIPVEINKGCGANEGRERKKRCRHVATPDRPPTRRGPSTGQPEKLDALGHVLTTQVPSAKSKYDPATDLRRWSRLPPPRGLPKYDVLSEIRSFFR